MIPVMKPWLGEEEARAAADAVASGWVAQGPRVAEFEQRFAERVGAEHGVAVSSCTTALHLAMYLLGLGPGDEVVVPSFSFIATANCAVYVGATPVFADVEPEDGNLSVRTVEPVLTQRTRAVIVVDQGGLPADVDPLRSSARVAASHWWRTRARPALAIAARRLAPGRTRGLVVPPPRSTTGEGECSRRRMLRWPELSPAEHGMNVSAADRHGSRQPVIELSRGRVQLPDDRHQAAVGLVQLEKLDEMVRMRRARAALAMLSDVRCAVRDPVWGESNFRSWWADRAYP